MALFPSAKSFLSVVLKDNLCKFYYRKISGKKIIDEKTDKFTFAENSELAPKLVNFADLEEKKLTTAILIDDKAQSAILGEYEMQDGLEYQKVDNDFVVSVPQSAIDSANELFGVKFNLHITLFKILYFLMKNQHFGDTAMYALKFGDKCAFIVADKDKVSYANIVSMKDHFEVDLGDEDEMFFEILRGEIDRFYADHESDFINNIFIYNDGSLGNEIGYVIFSRIFVKTNLTYIDFADFINKISIKESVKRR